MICWSGFSTVSVSHSHHQSETQIIFKSNKVQTDTTRDDAEGEGIRDKSKTFGDHRIDLRSSDAFAGDERAVLAVGEVFKVDTKDKVGLVR